VGALAPSFDSIICTSARHKGSDAAAIAAAVRKINPSADVHVATTVADALHVSRTLAESLKQKIYVAGGLFTAIEYAVVARGGRAEDLTFF
jgi:dihydrofolate synthase / folylpolyglutamate synthase